MSGTQSPLVSCCDAYAGLIAALDPDKDPIRAVAEAECFVTDSSRHPRLVAPAERLSGAPHSMQDDG